MQPTGLNRPAGSPQGASSIVAPSSRAVEGRQGGLATVYRRVAAMIDHDPLVRRRVQSLVRVAYGAPVAEGTPPAGFALPLATQTVRALGLGVAVATAADNLPQVSTDEADRYWHHALAVALTARELARRVGVRDRDRAFVAGFLHDVGLPLALLEASDRAAESGRGSSEGQTRTVSLEGSRPGHPEAGARLVEQWDLAPDLAHAIRVHHDSEFDTTSGQADALVRTLQVADWLTASQGLSVSGDPAASAGVPTARAALRLDDEALEQLCLGLDRRVSQVCTALGLRPVSPDLAARALFQAHLRIAQTPATVEQEPTARPDHESTNNLFSHIAGGLRGELETPNRLTAFVAAVADRPGIECVRCGLRTSDQEVMVADAGRDDFEAAPDLRRMPFEAWRAVMEDQAAQARATHATVELPEGRALDVIVRVSHADDLPAVSADIRVAAQVLALALDRPERPPQHALPEPAEHVRPGEQRQQEPSTAEQDDALRMLGEMAAGAAHDVNNGLAVILGQAQLGQVADSVVETQQYFDAIERASRDCAATVRRLQEFARSARKPRGVGEVDLGTLAQETLEITRPRWKNDAQRRGTVVRAAVDAPAPVPVQADAGALRQVITNLILNAVDAMPAGGTLTLKSWSEGDRALLSVADTGIGMTDEVISRLFEPFYTTKREAGTGLGLSVSKRIIEEHGGEIRVTSRPGLGSVFTVSLPYSDAPTEASPPEASPPAREALHVLLVDDEPQVRDVLMRMLRLDGHQAVPASTAAEGLELLEQQRFDLVLTDLGLPDMPGWQLARAAKAGGHNVPVVLVSGWTEEGERPTLAEGVDAVLAKPFGMVELRRVVKQAVESVDGAK